MLLFFFFLGFFCSWYYASWVMCHVRGELILIFFSIFGIDLIPRCFRCSLNNKFKKKKLKIKIIFEIFKTEFLPPCTTGLKNQTPNYMAKKNHPRHLFDSLNEAFWCTGYIAKNPSPLRSIISDSWYGGSKNVFGEKEKCRMVCYDIRHLKSPGPGKVWISPTPSHVSLKFLSWQSWMSWLI